MTASGIKPNRITYNILISLCAKALFMNTVPVVVLLDILLLSDRPMTLLPRRSGCCV